MLRPEDATDDERDAHVGAITRSEHDEGMKDDKPERLTVAVTRHTASLQKRSR